VGKGETGELVRPVAAGRWRTLQSPVDNSVALCSH
jgi:hypothetical protein